MYVAMVIVMLNVPFHFLVQIMYFFFYMKNQSLWPFCLIYFELEDEGIK